MKTHNEVQQSSAEVGNEDPSIKTSRSSPVIRIDPSFFSNVSERRIIEVSEFVSQQNDLLQDLPEGFEMVLFARDHTREYGYMIMAEVSYLDRSNGLRVSREFFVANCEDEFIWPLERESEHPSCIVKDRIKNVYSLDETGV